MDARCGGSLSLSHPLLERRLWQRDIEIHHVGYRAAFYYIEISSGCIKRGRKALDQSSSRRDRNYTTIRVGGIKTVFENFTAIAVGEQNRFYFFRRGADFLPFFPPPRVSYYRRNNEMCYKLTRARDRRCFA